MNLSDDEIVRQSREIAASSMSRENRRKRYAAFADAFPSLFDMACEGRVEESTLKLMLRMRQRVASNKMTGDAADTAVGVSLAKRFVEPTLSSLPLPPGVTPPPSAEGPAVAHPPPQGESEAKRSKTNE